MPGAIRLGLTGGIGSGKSTVAQMLAECGAAIIDADAISRGLTAPGGSAMSAIATCFGTEFITESGALNRDLMRALVFDQPQAKQRLEAIVHPLISVAAENQAKQAELEGRRCLVFDVPLLVEAGLRWRQRLDRILVVDCDLPTQIERVMARGSLTQKTVEGIASTQASREERLAAADWVICNLGLSLAELRAETEQIAKSLGL